MDSPPRSIVSRPSRPVKDDASAPRPRYTLSRVAIALLAGTLLALAGFLLTSVQGFALAANLAAAHPAARLLVAKHVAYAIPTVLLSLFSQSMVLFFFIGTGRLVKDEIAAFPQPDRAAVLDALRGFKRRTSPPATLALLSSIAVFVLGGAVHTRALSPWVHLAAALAAVGAHLWALCAEWAAFLDNGRLMADPAGYARLPPDSRR
jgi:anti-sigma factor RsiW